MTSLSPQAMLSPGIKVHPLNPATTPFIVGPTKKAGAAKSAQHPVQRGLTQPKGWGGLHGVCVCEPGGPSGAPHGEDEQLLDGGITWKSHPSFAGGSSRQMGTTWSPK